MPERQEPPRFERTELPSDIARLLDVANYLETDPLERLAMLDNRVHGLLDRLVAIAERAERMQRY